MKDAYRDWVGDLARRGEAGYIVHVDRHFEKKGSVGVWFKSANDILRSEKEGLWKFEEEQVRARLENL